ncbi:MAG: hypothetical protein WCB36_11265 [Burkholderiales bacterium]
MTTSLSICHSERSEESAVSRFELKTKADPSLSLRMTTSLLICHSERSEESAIPREMNALTSNGAAAPHLLYNLSIPR